MKPWEEYQVKAKLKLVDTKPKEEALPFNWDDYEEVKAECLYDEHGERLPSFIVSYPKNFVNICVLNNPEQGEEAEPLEP